MRVAVTCMTVYKGLHGRMIFMHVHCRDMHDLVQWSEAAAESAAARMPARRQFSSAPPLCVLQIICSTHIPHVLGPVELMRA